MGGGLWCLFSKTLRAMFVHRTNRAYIEQNNIGENACITGTKKGFKIDADHSLAANRLILIRQKLSKPPKGLSLRHLYDYSNTI